jgi:hypothetical protein
VAIGMPPPVLWQNAQSWGQWHKDQSVHFSVTSANGDHPDAQHLPNMSCFRTFFQAVLALVLALGASLAQAQVCAAPGKDGVSFSRNTYFPGQGSAAAGASVVNFGTARADANAASTPFAVGDLALVIQMQDALVNNTDSSAYGDGTAGDPASGSTNLRSAGFYEFKRVVAATGGSITVDSPLLNTYTTANADATTGQRRFQVVRVPQFASLTLPGGTVNVTPWDGSTGGLLALTLPARWPSTAPPSTPMPPVSGAAARRSR